MRTEIFHGVTSQKNMGGRSWHEDSFVSRVESVSVQEEFQPQEIPHPFASSLDSRTSSQGSEA